MRSHAALLNSLILAAFLPWGGLEGASRMTLTERKGKNVLYFTKQVLKILAFNLWVCVPLLDKLHDMQSSVSLFLLLLFPLFALGQNKQTDDLVVFKISYAYQFPGGDLDERFGNNLNVGLHIEYLTKRNWFLGATYELMYGKNVAIDPISSFRNADGLLYGDNFQNANVLLRERGFFTGLYAGKLISLLPDNPRSGLRIGFGGGLLQHKIRIQEDPVSFMPQLADDQKSSYDLLSNGLALKQMVGYHHISRDGLINFCIGFEIIEGWTENRRDFNYYTLGLDPAKRLDLLYGIRLHWILPIITNSNPDTIEY